MKPFRFLRQALTNRTFFKREDSQGILQPSLFIPSIHRTAVPVYLPAADGVMLTLAGVTGIALDGVDHAVLAFFYNADVIAATVALPIEENQVAGLRQIISVLPLSVFLEPRHAVRTEREFRDNARVDIAALVGTPRHITGAPRDA